MTFDIVIFLSETPPFDTLPEGEHTKIAALMTLSEVQAGTQLSQIGQPVDTFYIIVDGRIDITDVYGHTLSILGPKNTFGARDLLKGWDSKINAVAVEDSRVLTIPAAGFHKLMDNHPLLLRFFGRGGGMTPARGRDITTVPLRDVMTAHTVTCAPDTPLIDVARYMRDAQVSSVVVTQHDQVCGILTTRDIATRAVAEGVSAATPAKQIMTTNPVTLPPTALVADVLHEMVERGIAHIPVVEHGTLIGILTQTDLTRVQARSTAALIKDIFAADTPATIAAVTRNLPDVLVHLVGGQSPHHVVTRLITDVTDAATRRLLALAEQMLGPPPVPYLWLACGSQGRREQTGVSDQDNCLILDDRMTSADDAYFAALATFVCDGLHAAGYVYCPGDIMATNPRWRQPLHVWRRYFRGWIDTPNPEAQMLASVMFDLRPIGGDERLFSDLQVDTLTAAAANSIFVAHMVANAMKHAPPLGLFRNFATVRSGEHKNMIDMKHNGVIPVVDLGRIYALQGSLTAINTRARLSAAMEAGVISPSGGRDLIEAYDMIADARLTHQMAQIKRGERPDNFMAPYELSDFERNHLREAFLIIKTMQSAAGAVGGVLS